MSSLDDYGMRVSRRDLSAIYKAFKGGALGLTQREVSALYDRFDGVSDYADALGGAWADAVERVKAAADSCGRGDYADASGLLREVLDDFIQLPDAAAARATLDNAIRQGAVSVEKTAAGYRFTGATYDHKDAIKELYGAKWNKAAKAWEVMGKDVAELDQAAGVSGKVAAEKAKRAKRAARDGVKAYDEARAVQMRKVTRELEAVYRDALKEHIAELRRVLARYEGAQDPAEAIKLAYRRDELRALIEELARGLAGAGESAQKVAEGILPESNYLARNLVAWQVDNAAGIHVARFVGHDTAALAMQTPMTKPKWSEAEIAEATKLRSGYDARAWKHIGSKRRAEKKLRETIARGLLTGEHPTKIAKRLESVFDQWTRRAETIARTETNRVMSKATQQRIAELDKRGIGCSNRWEATLDAVTRESHRKVDGEVRKAGEKFSNGCLRPGDGSAAESINCRCSLTPVVDGFKPDVELRLDNETGELIPYMNYREWADKYAHEGGVKGMTWEEAARMYGAY